MSREIEIFNILNESTEQLQNLFEISYLEALIETMENILNDKKVSKELQIQDKHLMEQLESLYEDVPLEAESEELRRALQLSILKSIKVDNIQPNYQMTPDSIGFLVAYLIEVIAEPSKNVHIADLTVGTGNLLYTVHHYLMMKNRQVELTGVDNDEMMLALAATGAAFQKTEAHLMLQDGLRPILMEPANIIVSDLPVGYYPDDQNAMQFQTSFKKGHSYSHYLLIEQQLKYLDEGGFAFFILPTNVFNDPNANTLLEYLKKEAFIQGIIELPHNLFLNEDSRKSILVVQKHGNDAKQMKTLVAPVPEFKEMEAMENFLNQIKDWKKNNN